MRPSLRLSRRGVGMLLGGAAAVAGGLLLQALAVTAAGVFCLAVVGLCIGWVALRARRVGLQRRDVPTALRAGELFTSAVVVSSSLPDHGDAVVDGLVPPWAEGTDAGSAQTRLVAREAVVSRTCVAQWRGIYGWPALRLELPDPLGVAVGTVTATMSARTLVFPRVEALGAAPMPTANGGASEFDDSPSPARPVAGDTGLNPIPRQLRAGDSLRRMHWPATARAGEPMVRAEEPGSARRAVVLLDCRGTVYHDADAFERAVTATASIVVALLQRRWAVSLRLPGGGRTTSSVWLLGRRGEADVLAWLAGAELDADTGPSRPKPDDPVAAAFAVTGGGEPPRWSLPPAITIRTEHGVQRRSPADGVVWDGSLPLAAVWRAGGVAVVAQ